jgi:hypothetical protein
MTGFRSKSRAVLSSDPDQVFLLEAFYVFPARVRWSLIPEGAPAKQRRLDFRFGEDYWTVAPGQAASQPLALTADDSKLRGYDHSHRGWTDIHMELRRAVMLWPDGLAWEGEGTLRIARSPVEGHLILHGGPEPCPLVLLAHLDEHGRPEEIHAQGMPYGGVETFETGLALVDITWRQQGERWWPHTFTLRGWGGTEWRETVESVDVGVHAADSFFLPPDRRDTSGLAVSTAPMLVKLPPVVQRRVALAEGTPWEEALRAGERAQAEEAARLEPLGGSLESGLVLELGSDGGPMAVLLRLDRLPEPLPDGWNELPAGEGVTSRRGNGPVPGAALRRLAALVPPEAEAQVAYLRLPQGAAEGAPGQLVLPFRRAD